MVSTNSTNKAKQGWWNVLLISLYNTMSMEMNRSPCNVLAVHFCSIDVHTCDLYKVQNETDFITLLFTIMETYRTSFGLEFNFLVKLILNIYRNNFLGIYV